MNVLEIGGYMSLKVRKATKGGLGIITTYEGSCENGSNSSSVSISKLQAMKKLL